MTLKPSLTFLQIFNFGHQSGNVTADLILKGRVLIFAEVSRKVFWNSRINFEKNLSILAFVIHLWNMCKKITFRFGSQKIRKRWLNQKHFFLHNFNTWVLRNTWEVSAFQICEIQSKSLHPSVHHEDMNHRRDRQRSPSSYGHRILGSTRKIFCGIGSRFSGSIIKTALQEWPFVKKSGGTLAFVV